MNTQYTLIRIYVCLWLYLSYAMITCCHCVYSHIHIEVNSHIHIWFRNHMKGQWSLEYLPYRSQNTPIPLHWRHNDHDGVSNHQPHGCLLSRSKKTSKLRVTGLCVWDSPGPVNSPHKGPVTLKMFPFDDVIMPTAKTNVKQTWNDRVACYANATIGITNYAPHHTHIWATPTHFTTFVISVMPFLNEFVA